MAERRGQQSRPLGYLHIRAAGGCSSHDLRRLLEAFEDAYETAARVELRASAVTAQLEWLSRYGPPSPRYWPGLPVFGGNDVDVASAPEPLIVNRVVLEPPGFWGFLGAINSLEVVRRYLNDRHERRKDRDYRSQAERERLAIENALASLEVVRRIASLEREFGRELYSSEAWRRGWIGELRQPLGRLAEFSDRGIIEGDSARTAQEPPPPPAALDPRSAEDG